MAAPSCAVKSVVELSPDRQDFVKSLYPGIDVTENVDEVFGDPETEALVIATPVATHFEMVMQALGAGKHVLVEKPMAETCEQVEQIRELAEEKNLIAMVGHTFLYNAAVRALKRLIESGELGDVRYIYSQRLNLGRIRSDVDALWNLGPHDVSIIQYILGDPKPLSIFRQGMDYIQEDIDDVVFLDIIYPNKIMAHVHVSWLDPRKIRRMTVVGSEKMVVYDDVAEHKITVFDKGIDRMALLGENMDFDDISAIKFNHRSGDVLMPKIDFVEPLKVEIAHFIDCITNGTECLTGPDHALEVVRILSAEKLAHGVHL